MIGDLIPSKISRTHYIGDLDKSMESNETIIYGWAEHIRVLGKLVFVVLRDLTGKVQITLHAKKTPELYEKLKDLTPESALVVQGIIKPSEKAPRGFEITPSAAWIVAPAEPGVPLDVTDKIPAALSTRLDNRVLDLRKPKIQAIFHVQQTITWATHQFLRKNGFHEIHTPKIVAEKTEGGANVFPVTYFERDAYLAQSPQLYKQLMLLAGFDRVYEIAPVYRAEPHATVRHLNEYTSIDAEMSFIHDHHDVMDLHEALVRSILETVLEKNSNDLNLHEKTIDLPDKIPRIQYTQAIEWLQEQGEQIKIGNDLSSAQEKQVGSIVEKKYNSELHFLIDYPTEIRPFYTMPNSEDEKLTNSFDLIYRGMEITTGGQRINNYEMMIQGLKKKGIKPTGFEFYINPFKYGAPPHGGFGLGLERLTMQILRLDNIRESCFFPRDLNRLTP